MKFTAFLIFVSISLVNMVEAKELIIQCKPFNAYKLVSKFLLGTKVFKKVNGEWVPFCDADNQTLEVFDNAAACKNKNPLYVAEVLSIPEIEHLLKNCNGKHDFPTLHDVPLSDSVKLESLCKKVSENYFNIFDVPIINPTIADNDYWMHTFLIDFEFAHIRHINIGPSSKLETGKFAVLPSWYRNDYEDPAGYPWRIPDTSNTQPYECEKR